MKPLIPILILLLSSIVKADSLTEADILSKIHLYKDAPCQDDQKAISNLEWCAFYCNIFGTNFAKSKNLMEVWNIYLDIQKKILQIKRRHEGDKSWLQSQYERKHEMMKDMSFTDKDIELINAGESLGRLYLSSGSEYLTLGDLERGRDQYKKIIEDTDSSLTKEAVTRLCTSYEKREGIDELKKWIDSLNPKAKSSALFEFISYLYDNSRYDNAIKELDAFLKSPIDPDMAFEGRFLYAMCWYRKGNMEKAVGLWKYLIQAYPLQADKVQFTIGWAYLSCQNYPLAKKELEKLKTKYPNSKYVPQATPLLKRIGDLIAK